MDALSPFPQIERTYDTSLIKQVMTDPAIWDFIADDGSPAPSDFEPLNPHGVIYLQAIQGCQLAGLFLFVPQNLVSYEVHTCLLPEGRGAFGVEAAKAAARWMWQNTTAKRIFTNIPSYNRPARWFAKAAGMRQFGINPLSYQKDGQLYDQYLLGLGPAAVSSIPCEVPPNDMPASSRSFKT